MFLFRQRRWIEIRGVWKQVSFFLLDEKQMTMCIGLSKSHYKASQVGVAGMSKSLSFHLYSFSNSFIKIGINL